MIKIYRGAGCDSAPVPMECEVFGYPNKTVEGEVMYSNTHFLSEEEAWRSILDDREAGVRIYIGLVERAGVKLQRYKARLESERRRRDDSQRLHSDWLKREGRGGGG